LNESKQPVESGILGFRVVLFNDRACQYPLDCLLEQYVRGHELLHLLSVYFLEQFGEADEIALVEVWVGLEQRK